MRLVGSAPGGKFDTGDVVRVTEAMNLRTSASTSAGVVAIMPAGTTGEIIGGPQSGSGYTWWQIDTPLGTGWAVENWLTEGSIVDQLIAVLVQILRDILS